MSWNISFKAESKDAATATLAEKVEEAAGHCPDSAARACANAIDALPECEDSHITVSFYGHFNDGSYRGTSNMVVNVENHFNE